MNFDVPLESESRIEADVLALMPCPEDIVTV
jgi:hypothetical protein